MMRSLMAVLALVIGLSFGAVTFVQADEKAPGSAPMSEGAAAPAEKKDMAGDKMGGEKKDMGGEKKAEKKEHKKKKKM